ncbi:MAG: adenosylmethionine decarboxylase [Thermodesulfobacteriota bacterium]|nr:adenosylmethionine decarboxylase [Desulfovibrionales bacterium]MDD5451353.1 adenosylmethionine decarboxylase [Desulfovibrionales bacterium]MDQ7839192.1 adenosylmethionine decarboxylase [Thermodesulfobacteriota bacterium]
MENIEFGFGQHLMVDGYGSDQDKLTDINYIYDFLSNYPAEIEMTKIMPPYVFRYSGVRPEDWGISGFVLIAESHISIHTFPEKRYLSLDIFSCKEFNGQKAIEDVKRLFSLEKIEIRNLERGLEFPKIIRKVENFMRDERMQISI